jgi:hypothetical protein
MNTSQRRDRSTEKIYSKIKMREKSNDSKNSAGNTIVRNKNEGVQQQPTL